MFTVKIVHADNRVTLLSYESFHFIGAESEHFGVMMDMFFDKMTEHEVAAYDEENPHNEKGVREFPYWGFVYDIENPSEDEMLEFGDKLYVTDISGKTVYSQEAWVPSIEEAPDGGKSKQAA